MIAPAQRRAMAFHEAGHAAAAHLLGFPIQQVNITFGKDTDGYFAGEIRTDVWAPLRDLDDRARQLATEQVIRRHVVMIFAGPAAQRIHAPRSRIPSSAEKDYRQASEWAALACYTDAHPAFMRWADREARALVKFHWHLVEAVAEALLAREDITGDQVVAVIEGAEERQRELLRSLPPPTDEQLDKCAAKKRARSIGRREVADSLLRAYVAGAKDLEGAVVADLAVRREADAGEVAAKVRRVIGGPESAAG